MKDNEIPDEVCEDFRLKVHALLTEVDRLCGPNTTEGVALCIISTAVLGTAMNIPKNRLLRSFMQSVEEIELCGEEFRARKLQ